jgi:pilus assembly protein CpaB
VPQFAFSDPKDVIGRGIVMPMIQNEPFLPMKLAAKDGGTGLTPAIPPGLRAVSVKVNEVIGVAGYVLPGTHVDVVATVSPNQNQADMTTKVILTNVEVLAAGTKIERTTDKDKPMPVTVVTMLVDPEQAERLTLASTEGKIQLALRNPLDKTTPDTPGIRPAVLLGFAKAPAPRGTGTSAHSRPVATMAAAPTAEPTVEMIRGDKRNEEVVR